MFNRMMFMLNDFLKRVNDKRGLIIAGKINGNNIDINLDNLPLKKGSGSLIQYFTEKLR